MPSPTYRDPFVWHELMTSDVDAALAFYQKVIGWKKQAHDPTYTMLLAKTGPVAGVMLLPDEAKAMGSPPCWLIYIGTHDVDGTARRAEELGAKVLKEGTDIPEVGRFAVLQDPQGAAFAVFQPLGSNMSAPSPPEVGGFSWHELTTTDWEGAIDFYSRLFGFEKTEATDMGAMGTYQMYGVDGKTLGGMMNRTPDMPPPYWLAYISVPSADQASAKVKALGGQVIRGPMEVPGGDRISICMDPQGVVFAVHSRKPAAKAAPAPKPAAKKPAAPKPVAKKPAAKKPAAKKAAAKKRPAKKAAAKKRPAKKAAAKKRPAKKAARKVARKKKAAPRRAKKRVVRRAKAVARRRPVRPRRKAGAKRRRR